MKEICCWILPKFGNLKLKLYEIFVVNHSGSSNWLETFLVIYSFSLKCIEKNLVNYSYFGVCPRSEIFH